MTLIQNPPSVDANVQASQLAALLAFGRRSSSWPAATVLLQDAVALLVDLFKADLGGFSEVASDGRSATISVVRVDRQGSASTVARRAIPLDPTRSMNAYAMSSASPVVVANVAIEHRFHDALLHELGITSGIVVPLPGDERPLGAIGIYCLKSREFGLHDVQFPETIAHMAASSLARLRAEEQLRREQSLAATVLDSVDSLVVMLDHDRRVRSMNRAASHATGRSSEVMRGKDVFEALFHREDVETARHVLDHLDSDQRQFDARLASSANGERWYRWKCRTVATAHGNMNALVLTGAPLARKDSAEDGQALNQFAPVGQAGGRDKRTSVRRVFQCSQLIAPMFGTTIPSRQKFFAVQCRDISAGGFSFLLKNAPDFQRLVIALGRPPDVSYLTARVVRLLEIEEEGRKQVLVGCQFTDRVQL